MMLERLALSTIGGAACGAAWGLLCWNWTIGAIIAVLAALALLARPWADVDRTNDV
jgi:hypothetical protein